MIFFKQCFYQARFFIFILFFTLHASCSTTPNNSEIQTSKDAGSSTVPDTNLQVDKGPTIPKELVALHNTTSCKDWVSETKSLINKHKACKQDSDCTTYSPKVGGRRGCDCGTSSYSVGKGFLPSYAEAIDKQREKIKCTQALNFSFPCDAYIKGAYCSSGKCDFQTGQCNIHGSGERPPSKDAGSP